MPWPPKSNSSSRSIRACCPATAPPRGSRGIRRSRGEARARADDASRQHVLRHPGSAPRAARHRAARCAATATRWLQTVKGPPLPGSSAGLHARSEYECRLAHRVVRCRAPRDDAVAPRAAEGRCASACSYRSSRPISCATRFRSHSRTAPRRRSRSTPARSAPAGATRADRRNRDRDRLRRSAAAVRPRATARPRPAAGDREREQGRARLRARARRADGVGAPVHARTAALAERHAGGRRAARHRAGLPRADRGQRRRTRSPTPIPNGCTRCASGRGGCARASASFPRTPGARRADRRGQMARRDCWATRATGTCSHARRCRRSSPRSAPMRPPRRASPACAVACRPAAPRRAPRCATPCARRDSRSCCSPAARCARRRTSAATTTKRCARSPRRRACSPRQLIERRHHKARRAGRPDLAHASPGERHAARIAAKKLRYAAEFFAPLFRGKRARRYLEVAVRAAGCAGTRERRARRCSHLVDGLPAPGDVAMAGAIRGWVAAHAAALAKDIARVAGRFAEVATGSGPTGECGAPAMPARTCLSRAALARRRPRADDPAALPAAGAPIVLPARARADARRRFLGFRLGRRSRRRNDTAPLVVLFHGLESSSNSHYARALMAGLAEIGWRGVIPHFRGCSGEPNLLPRAYHSGDHEEVGAMLAAIRVRIGARRPAVRRRRVARRQRAPQLAGPRGLGRERDPRRRGRGVGADRPDRGRHRHRPRPQPHLHVVLPRDAEAEGPRAGAALPRACSTRDESRASARCTISTRP